MVTVMTQTWRDLIVLFEQTTLNTPLKSRLKVKVEGGGLLSRWRVRFVKVGRLISSVSISSAPPASRGAPVVMAMRLIVTIIIIVNITTETLFCTLATYIALVYFVRSCVNVKVTVLGSPALIIRSEQCVCGLCVH